MKRKSVTALVLSFAMIMGTVPVGSFADKKNFSDIKDTYWANEAINTLVNTGVFNGYPNGKFGPEDSMTREQFAAILYKAFELETTQVNAATFKDVDASRWSYNYIEAAKPYLTGYFPPKGKPSFDPNGLATREDVAVALVMVLNLNEIEQGNISDLDFKDTESISPKLRDEIALAVKYDLIKGFPDNSFKPDSAITRAQAATLIFKVMKSTYQSEAANQAYSINMPAKVSAPSVPIEVKMPKGTQLYINNNLVEDHATSYKQTWKIESGVGQKTVEFKLIMPSGKVVKETKTVLYEAVSPELYIENWQDKTDQEYVTVKGNIYHKDDLTTAFYINDKAFKYDSKTGKFETTLKLVSGENKFTFRTSNNAGKSYQVTKSVVYTPKEAEAPQILITNLAEKTNAKNIEFTIKVTDRYDSYVDLYINDRKYTVKTDKNYTTPLTLEKGDNKVIFKVTNSKKKQTVIERHVNLNVGAPTLELVSATTTETQQYQLKLKTTDVNYKYSNLAVTVNGRKASVDYYGNVKYNMDLNLGVNLINVEVTNPDGLSTKIAYQVTYAVKQKEAPKLNVYVPDTTNVTSGGAVTISGNVYDVEDSSVKVTINGESVAVSKSGNFSKNVTVKSGENAVVIRATNLFGVVTEIKKLLQIK
jgi:hypothetical protein